MSSSRESTLTPGTAPAGTGTPDAVIASSSASVHPGLTRNRAPAATASSTPAGEITVPAPTTASGTSAAMARTQSSAAGGPQRHLDSPAAPRDQRTRERHRVGGVLQDNDRDDGRKVQYGSHAVILPPTGAVCNERCGACNAQ